MPAQVTSPRRPYSTSVLHHATPHDPRSRRSIFADTHPVSFSLKDHSFRLWTVSPQSSRRCCRFVHPRTMLHKLQLEIKFLPSHCSGPNSPTSTGCAMRQQMPVVDVFQHDKPSPTVSCTPYSARLSTAKQTPVVTSSWLPTSGFTKKRRHTCR